MSHLDASITGDTILFIWRKEMLIPAALLLWIYVEA